MDLIKRNTPAYFAEEVAADLSKYLDNEIERYYVVLFDNKREIIWKPIAGI